MNRHGFERFAVDEQVVDARRHETLETVFGGNDAALDSGEIRAQPIDQVRLDGVFDDRVAIAIDSGEMILERRLVYRAPARYSNL
jgi:hypothetical protein